MSSVDLRTNHLPNYVRQTLATLLLQIQDVATQHLEFAKQTQDVATQHLEFAKQTQDVATQHLEFAKQTQGDTLAKLK